MQGFRELVEGFMAGQADKNAYEIGTDIIRQSGIINDVCQDTSPENLSRKENIEELVNGMNDFCALRQEEGNPNISLTDFLSEIALLTDQDSDKADDGEKITLMTVHSAKGLEFKNVFVVGLKKTFSPVAWRAILPVRWKKSAVCSTWLLPVRKNIAIFLLPRPVSVMERWSLEVPVVFCVTLM